MRFRKTEPGDEAASFDHDVGEKQPEPEFTPIDVGPGGFSFEEGALVRSLGFFFVSIQALILRRHCWRAWPSSRRHLMHPSYRRTYHWYRYLLHPILHSEWNRVHWRVPHALGPRIRSLLLWLVHLA